MALRVTLGSALLSSVGACGWLVDASAVCAKQAQVRGPELEVAGAFSTTVGTVRTVFRGQGALPEERFADAEAAVLCYLDGEVPMGPPAGGDAQPNFDRTVVAVVGDAAVPVLLGSREDIDIRDPNQ